MRRQQKYQQKMIEQGRCRQCGQDAESGLTRCRDCLEKKYERDRFIRAARKLSSNKED